MNMCFEKYKKRFSETEKSVIKKTAILLLADLYDFTSLKCLLEFGFEKITIVNFRNGFVNKKNSKDEIDVEVLKELMSSYPKATILNCGVNTIEKVLLPELDYLAINLLDVKDDRFFQFNTICKGKNIHILCPYDLGVGVIVFRISPKGLCLKFVQKEGETLSLLTLIEYVVAYNKFWGNVHLWLEGFLIESKTKEFTPSRFSIITDFMCYEIFFKILMKRDVKEFPEFYLLKK